MVGDSVTFGWGVELEESIPKQLEVILRNTMDRRIEVLNFGYPGANLQREVAPCETKK